MKKTKSKTTAKNVYFGVRIDRELIKHLRRRAQANDRNTGAELNRILRTALSTAEEEK